MLMQQFVERKTFKTVFTLQTRCNILIRRTVIVKYGSALFPSWQPHNGSPQVLVTTEIIDEAINVEQKIDAALER